MNIQYEKENDLQHIQAIEPFQQTPNSSSKQAKKYMCG